MDTYLTTYTQKKGQRINLKDFPELDYLLDLARSARKAQECGDLETARHLRIKHDQLYTELYKRLPTV